MCQSFPVASRGRPPLHSDEAILEKALAAFASSGYSAMSVRALNADLGLSHEAISQRFGSKSDLFRAAVGHGFDLFITDFDREVGQGAPANDLEWLRATVRAFMMSTSRHPTLGELLHHENIDETQRMVMIGETGLGERIANTVSLLRRLHNDGVIRQTAIRDLWFLAEGAAAPLRFQALSMMFDPFDGPLEGDSLIERMTDAIMRSMLIRPEPYRRTGSSDPGTPR